VAVCPAICCLSVIFTVLCVCVCVGGGGGHAPLWMSEHNWILLSH
jgi:hypothetical protein